ncbi:hypothetical protein JTB14_012533 [Gonioctena quinquepunctata]|nr:hypothetical protein JTB14_012533 [Gonioctena quinquepunctata]
MFQCSILEEKCTDEQIDEHYSYRDDFENSYNKYIGILEQYLRDNGALAPVNQVNDINNNNVQNSWNNISLQKIKIDTFKGEYELWFEFKSSSLSVVDRSYISNIQKFQILRQSVDGYAKRIVDQVEFVGGYYDTAWKALCERFDNPINKHIEGVLKLKQLVRESSTQLRDLHDLVSKNISAIEEMKISKEVLSELLLIHFISEKLDESTYRGWKEHKTPKELPTLNNSFEFLKIIIDTLSEIANQSINSVSSQKNVKNMQYNPSSCQNRDNVRRNFFINNQSKMCYFCKEPNHYMYTCIDFLKLDVPRQISEMNELNQCKNCLRPRHAQNECTLGPCMKFNLEHNPLIHIDEENSKVQL